MIEIPTKKIYRIENEETMHGMWYRGDATYDPFIKKLTDGKCADLPMDFHERYSKGGLRWFSAGGSIEDMHHWFSSQDAVELFQAGYKLYEFESGQFITEEHQVLFTREGIKSKVEISLDTIWDVGKDYKAKINIREE